MKNKILMKFCTKYMSVLLVLILLLSFTGCQKTYAFEEVRQSYDELRADWENGKYPGLTEMTGDVLTVDFNYEKAEQTAESLKLKYGDKIIVRICEIYISQL